MVILMVQDLFITSWNECVDEPALCFYLLYSGSILFVHFTIHTHSVFLLIPYAMINGMSMIRDWSYGLYTSIHLSLLSFLIIIGRSVKNRNKIFIIVTGYWIVNYLLLIYYFNFYMFRFNILEFPNFLRYMLDIDAG